MMMIFGLLIVPNVRRKRQRIDVIYTMNPTISLAIRNHSLTQQQHEGNKQSILPEMHRPAQKRDVQCYLYK